MNELERIKNIRVKLSIAKEAFENGNLTIEEFQQITLELKNEINYINESEKRSFFLDSIIKGNK